MTIAEAQRHFVVEVLSEKYGDLASLNSLSRAVTGKHLDSFTLASDDLQERIRKFAEKLVDSPRLFARWNLVVLKKMDDDHGMRQKFRSVFYAEDTSLPSMALPSNAVVSIVCEESQVALATRLRAAIVASKLLLHPRLLTVGPTSIAGTLDEDFLSDLQASDFVIECRTSHRETMPLSALSALMAVATIKDFRVAYLPGYEWGIPSNIPSINLTKGFTKGSTIVREAFGDLIEDTARSLTPRPPANPWSKLAENIVSNGLAVCVGADLPERLSGQMPSRHDMAAQMLVEAGLIEPASTADLLRREPLVPQNWASFLNRLMLTDGSDDQITEWKRGLGRRLRNSVGPTPTLIALAEFLRTVKAKPPEGGGRTIIITTNVDLAIESAFIGADLEFEALVLQPATRSGQLQPSYSAVFTQKQPIGGKTVVSGIEEETADRLAAERRQRWQDQYAQEVPDTSATSVETYFARRLRNRLVGRIYRAAENAARGVAETKLPPPDPTRPLLVKLNGSCHREGDFIAAVDEGLYLDDAVSDRLRQLLVNSTMVLIGYGLADQELLSFHSTILRKHQMGSKGRRVVLVDPSAGPPSPFSTSNPEALESIEKGLVRQGSYLGFDVIRTDVEPSLRAIAKSYESAIDAADF